MERWDRMTLRPARGLRSSIGLRSNKLIYTTLEEPRWPLINPFKRRNPVGDVPAACTISSVSPGSRQPFEVRRLELVGEVGEDDVSWCGRKGRT